MSAPQTREAMAAEIARQTEIIFRRLDAVLMATGKEFDPAMLNSAIGAIAALAGKTLLAIPPGRVRKGTRDALYAQIEKFMRQNANADVGQVQLYDLGAPKN